MRRGRYGVLGRGYGPLSGAEGKGGGEGKPGRGGAEKTPMRRACEVPTFIRKVGFFLGKYSHSTRSHFPRGTDMGPAHAKIVFASCTQMVIAYNVSLEASRNDFLKAATSSSSGSTERQLPPPHFMKRLRIPFRRRFSLYYKGMRHQISTDPVETEKTRKIRVIRWKRLS